MDTALKSKFDQILALQKNAEKLEDAQQITPYLRYVTGYRYCLEKSSRRKWDTEENAWEEGVFYHIIPDKVDNGFFDWYLNNRPYHQMFQTAEMALLYFLFYWHAWHKEIHAQATSV